MKTPKEHQVRVGLFITAGITILCLSIFFLGGSNFLKSQVYFKARFPQIQGLQNGSVISFTGIIVGNIETIDLLTEENIVEISMKIDAKYAQRFTEGSEVDIRTQGALGDKYIFVKPGSPQAKPLMANAIIPTMHSTDIIAVFNERGDQAVQIFDILNDLHRITQSVASENQLGTLISNTNSAVSQLKKTLAESEILIKEIRGGAKPNEVSKMASSMNKLDHILSRLDKGEGTLGALLTDSTIHERLKILLGADKKTNSIRSLMRTSIEHQDPN